MVNARLLEPDPRVRTVSTTLKEMEVVDEGGFQTTTYQVLIGRKWQSVHGLLDASPAGGIEVELLDHDTAPGVPWRRWLRVTAPAGTIFIKRIRTPNRERARVDMESVPYDIEDLGLVLSARAPPPASSRGGRRDPSTRVGTPRASGVEHGSAAEHGRHPRALRSCGRRDDRVRRKALTPANVGAGWPRRGASPGAAHASVTGAPSSRRGPRAPSSPARPA